MAENDVEAGRVIVENVDISHSRLVDLTKLADHARPFYDWAEKKFQTRLAVQKSLDEILLTATQDQIAAGLSACYNAVDEQNIPILFDGVGRSYPHQTACYYFFSWVVRDAPRQRLEPLLQRIKRLSRKSRVEVEIDALSSLIYRYRADLKTFMWEAVREVMIDRLEGSRRSIRGHEKEIVVRTAMLLAVQSYYLSHTNYGVYARVELNDKQVKIGRETFDVSVNLLDKQASMFPRFWSL